MTTSSLLEESSPSFRSSGFLSIFYTVITHKPLCATKCLWKHMGPMQLASEWFMNDTGASNVAVKQRYQFHLLGNQ